MKEALDMAKRLRVQARKLPPEKALELLDQAIASLQDAVARQGADSELYRDLAECLGMRGGALRRLARLDEAVASYREGKKYEQDKDYGSDDSYNLVNALVTPLLKTPSLLDDAAFRNELSQAVMLLRRQTRGSRSADFWAYADLARCLLLQQEYEGAIRALDRFVQLGGLKDGFASSIQALRELEEASSSAGRPEARQLAEAIAYFRAASERGSMAERPTCFVLMPFGPKKNAAGQTIDFDQIYRRIIEPAILDAGLAPVRADAETSGPVIHKAMFERLLLSEIAIADLTLNNPNVFYELGVRHGNRARVTVLMSGESSAPFDVNLLRTLRYKIGDDGALGDDEIARVRVALKVMLDNARRHLVDSTLSDNPIAALLNDFKSLDEPARFKTDVFRDISDYEEELKRALADARARRSVSDLRRIEEHIKLEESEPGVMIDLMLSYRALKSWDDMLTFIARMPKIVRDTEMVREQQALALNRRNKGSDRYQALNVIEALIAEQGPSSESHAILGRIYKDLWQSAKEGEPYRARGLLRKAIDAYRHGFQSDVRDTYPGINLASLLEIDGSKAALEESARVLAVLNYVTALRDPAKRDYWDHATLLEISILRRAEEDIVDEHLQNALGSIRETFEPESTALNLRYLRDARQRRGIDDPLIERAIDELQKAAKAHEREAGRE